MPDLPPPRPARTRRPEFVLSVWRAPTGHWQGRLKSLRDGTEKLLSDISELPQWLGEWSAPEESHAQA